MFFAFHFRLIIFFPIMKGNFCASFTYKRETHPYSTNPKENSGFTPTTEPGS